MKLNNFFDDADEVTSEKIAEKYPVLRDSDKERLFAMSKKKYDTNENMVFNTENQVSGVEKYKRPVWRKPLGLVAAAVLAVGAVGGGLMYISRNNNVQEYASESSEDIPENSSTEEIEAETPAEIPAKSQTPDEISTESQTPDEISTESETPAEIPTKPKTPDEISAKSETPTENSTVSEAETPAKTENTIIAETEIPAENSDKTADEYFDYNALANKLIDNYSDFYNLLYAGKLQVSCIPTTKTITDHNGVSCGDIDFYQVTDPRYPTWEDIENFCFEVFDENFGKRILANTMCADEDMESTIPMFCKTADKYYVNKDFYNYCCRTKEWDDNKPEAVLTPDGDIIATRYRKFDDGVVQADFTISETPNGWRITNIKENVLNDDD